MGARTFCMSFLGSLLFLGFLIPTFSPTGLSWGRDEVTLIGLTYLMKTKHFLILSPVLYSILKR